MSGDHYKTPDFILDLFDTWFDPCPFDENPKFDGLQIEWKNKTYCNPPYSQPGKWINKAIEESKKGKTIVMLLRVDTSTKWFAKLIENDAKILWFAGRLKFNGKPANFPSMLVILNNKKTGNVYV